MTDALCYCHYPVTPGTEKNKGTDSALTKECENRGTEKCPVTTMDYKKLKEPPCCFAIFIPCRFLTQADGDVKKAARLYIEECLLE